jgi:hypothetical protein
LQAVFNASWERNEPQRAMNAITDAAKYGAAAIGIIATGGIALETAPLIAPALMNASLRVGAMAALNPAKTTMTIGFTQGFLDKGFNLRTGFPNLDPLGAASEEFGKYVTGEMMDIYNSFELNNDLRNQSFDSGNDLSNNNSFWETNSYE